MDFCNSNNVPAATQYFSSLISFLIVTVHLILILPYFLKAIRHEAFTHMEGQKEFVQIDHNDMFPYLLVNVGSGVSIIKVLIICNLFFF